jgi:hypothetical protein
LPGARISPVLVRHARSLSTAGSARADARDRPGARRRKRSHAEPRSALAKRCPGPRRRRLDREAAVEPRIAIAKRCPSFERKASARSADASWSTATGEHEQLRCGVSELPRGTSSGRAARRRMRRGCDQKRSRFADAIIQRAGPTPHCGGGLLQMSLGMPAARHSSCMCRTSRRVRSRPPYHRATVPPRHARVLADAAVDKQNVLQPAFDRGGIG